MASRILLVLGILFLATTLYFENVTCQASSESSTSAELLHRRVFVKDMFKYGWDAYQRFAWGRSTLQPIVQTGSIESNGKTIIHSLPNLWLMNLTTEYAQARAWLELSYAANRPHFDHLGPLLSAYALSNDSLFLNRARQIADAMLPLMNSTDHPILTYWMNIASLEFIYLNQITGNSSFYLDDLEQNFKTSRNGLEYKIMTQNDAAFAMSERVIVDIKKLIQTNNTNGKTDLTFFNFMISTLNSSGLLHQADWPPNPMYILPNNSTHEQYMYQMDCSYGTIFALAFKVFEGHHHYHYQSFFEPTKLLRLAKEITKTCYLGANSSELKLPQNMMSFNDNNKKIEINGSYSLEPHLAEAYFTLFRVTGDEQYRNYAWELAQAIEKHCKVGTGGYAGFDHFGNKVDEQPEEFLSSTLMYLYLIFEDPSVLPLDKWVFTVKGHPLPIIGI